MHGQGIETSEKGAGSALPSGKGHGNFFAVDRRCFAEAADVGLNAAVAYLVMARFSLRDNRTQRASTKAVETHTSISRQRAKDAIARLEQRGLVSPLNGRVRTLQPYHLPASGRTVSERDDPASPDKPHWVWLPNELVTGAA